MQSRSTERGQILVLFALALIAMIAAVGLVLDGGSTFGQRRGEQNAADLAALAGAVVQINGGTDAAIRAKAQEVAKANRYDSADPNVVVTVTPLPGTVQVDITAPHQNYFAGVVGMPTWNVSVIAKAAAGVPTGAIGAAPFVFSAATFDPITGNPKAPYGCSVPPPPGGCVPYDFGEGNGDIPKDAGDMSWTLYGPNVNSNAPRPYLAGLNLVSPTFNVGDYIGQSNNGNHNALYGSGEPADPVACSGNSSHTNVATCLSGKDVVVPIVAPAGTTCTGGEDGGCFEGWALFHVVTADKHGQTSFVRGYFVSGFSRGVSSDGICVANGTTCISHGLYALKLVN